MTSPSAATDLADQAGSAFRRLQRGGSHDRQPDGNRSEDDHDADHVDWMKLEGPQRQLAEKAGR